MFRAFLLGDMVFPELDSKGKQNAIGEFGCDQSIQSDNNVAAGQ